MAEGIRHIFNEDDFVAIFSRDDLRLEVCPLKDIGVATPSEMASESSQLQPALEQTVQQTHCACESTLKSPNTTDPRPHLGRLTLAVSNACNLSCAYCYASDGTYYNESGLIMKRDTVLHALNYIAHHYSRVEHINFFGGEPTLNADSIEIACEYVRYLHQKGILSHMPSFGITTNGYRLNDRMLEILSGYTFSVALSLDGPKLIHDLLRPTKDGKGSYEAVRENARRLLNRGVRVAFESTYTPQHAKMGLRIKTLMDFFYDEFNCNILHCPIVLADPANPLFVPLAECLDLQGEAIEYSIFNIFHGTHKMTSLAAQMLHSLVNRQPIWNYCPAGRTEITINADGGIYACFMLMQSYACGFGNVNEWAGIRPPLKVIGQDVSSVKRVIERSLLEADKYTNKACGQCWAQPLCFGCLGEDFARCNRPMCRSHVSGTSAFCDYKRGLVERFLRSVARSIVQRPL